MLYQLHEMQRSFLTPLMQWADASSKLFSNPGLPFCPHPVFPAYRRRLRADVSTGQGLRKTGLRHRHGQHQRREPSRSRSMRRSTKPFCKLVHFKKDLPDAAFAALAQPTVLLVAPLSGHHSTLLRDTVRALLPDHDVFITDWIDARMVPLSSGPFHLDDYIYLRAGLHPRPRPGRARDLRLPADRAGAGRDFADGLAPTIRSCRRR